MSGEGEHPAPARWAARARERPQSYRYLFDLDPDLAEVLDVRMRMAARSAVTAVTLELGAGELDLGPRLAATGAGPGLLVLHGVIAAHTRVGNRVAAELLGAGDLLQPCGGEDELLVCEEAWRALVPARFAVLDGGFAERVVPWPQVTHALLRRAGLRARRLGVQRAIASQPRLEVRLELLLWHLAARWGKVERGGIRLPVPLTHQLLGRLIGAERPSVSHALARLAQSGVVTGHGDEWHLHGTLEDGLMSLVEPSAGRVEQLMSAAAHRPW